MIEDCHGQFPETRMSFETCRMRMCMVMDYIMRYSENVILLVVPLLRNVTVI